MDVEPDEEIAEILLNLSVHDTPMDGNTEPSLTTTAAVQHPYYHPPRTTSTSAGIGGGSAVAVRGSNGRPVRSAALKSGAAVFTTDITASSALGTGSAGGKRYGTRTAAGLKMASKYGDEYVLDDL